MITVIIPTLCSAERYAPLCRAISSLKKSTSESLHILIVVNGDRVDESIFLDLSNRKDLQVVRIFEKGAPAAQLAGRRLVKSKYFCFLDDDDEILPGGLDIRLNILGQNVDAAAVVTNGLFRSNSTCDLVFKKFPKGNHSSALRSLFEENWLSSCGALFRTDAISVSYFEDYAEYIEWTWLAFKLATASVKIIFDESITFQINDSGSSVSKSEKYLLFHPVLFRKMLASCHDKELKNIIRARQRDAWHQISEHYIRSGKLRSAILPHIYSLIASGGYRYIGFSRYFFLRRNLPPAQSNG